MEIEGVGCCATRVEDAERTNDARSTRRRRESECREVDLLFGPRSPGLHMGQHFAECAKAFGASGAAGNAAQYQSQVVAKSAIDGVAQTQLHRVGCGFARRSPAKKWRICGTGASA